MDGHADLVGAFGFSEADGPGNSVNQGELFARAPQFNALGLPHLESANSMGASERSQFFEGCLRAQENERLKLGRELHDSTGQLLLALRLEIARLREVYGTSVQGPLLD